jgi:hypothetical protein
MKTKTPSIIAAVLIAGLAAGCSKGPSSSTGSASSSVPDLGVVDFPDSTPKYYSLGGDKSCTITGVTDSKGITLDIVFSVTNADKTVRILGTPQIRVTSSRSSCMASAGNVAVRFTPKFKTP